MAQSTLTTKPSFEGKISATQLRDALETAKVLRITAQEVRAKLDIDVPYLNWESTEDLWHTNKAKILRYIAEQNALATPEGFQGAIRDALSSEALVNLGALKQRFHCAAFEEMAEGRNLPLNPAARRTIANAVIEQWQKAETARITLG